MEKRYLGDAVYVDFAEVYYKLGEIYFKQEMLEKQNAL